MAPRGLTLLIALALCAAAAAAYRPAPLEWMQEDAPYLASWATSTHQTPLAASTTLVTRGGGGGGPKEPAYGSIKYYVGPERHDKFIKAWREFEEDTADEKGCEIVDLKKTVEDDVTFLSYGEWKSFDDFVDHLQSEHFEKWTGTLRDMDIPWVLQPLYQPKDAGEFRRDVGPQEEGKKKRHLAHMLIRYIAPPSAEKELVGAWHEAMQETSKEEGIRIYSLRKTAHDNTQWIGYGTWESMEDLHRHFKSDHIEKLKDRLGKIHAYWRITLLYKIGDQPE